MVALQPGAALLVVSRGIVEARHRSEEFGLQKVKNERQRAQSQTAQEICATVLGGVREFIGKSPVRNDATVIALARTAAGRAFSPAV